KAGTRLDIVLGRRPTRNVPRPLDHLAFRARLDLAMELNRVNGVLQVKRIPIKVDATPLRIQGVVGDSLYRSARAAGAPPKSIQSFLRVIAQQIPIEDIRSGDRYDIILDYRRAETGDVEVGDLLYAGLGRTRGKSLDMLKWTNGDRTEWFEASGVGQRRGVLSMPVSGHVSSSYGMRRHPILGYTRMHAGIDFAASYGSPIYAATDGIVEYAGRHGGHGNYVKLRHGGGIATGYAHMSRIAASVGQRVRRGQVIGYVGSTGLSTGPHLHYELYRNGVNINPNSVKFTTVAQLTGKALANFKARLTQLKSLRVGLHTSEPAKVAQTPSIAGAVAKGK
ncbi:MAG: M23 family metallopeptidase, partial [Sphingobium phenoxybenzoativorans]